MSVRVKRPTPYIKILQAKIFVHHEKIVLHSFYMFLWCKQMFRMQMEDAIVCIPALGGDANTSFYAVHKKLYQRKISSYVL